MILNRGFLLTHMKKHLQNCIFKIIRDSHRGLFSSIKTIHYEKLFNVIFWMFINQGRITPCFSVSIVDFEQVIAGWVGFAWDF